MANFLRVATAGGFNNPALNLNFAPDVAGAHQNALLTQQGQQINQMRGQQIADYPADRNFLLQQREREQQQQPIQDARAGFLFMSKVLPTVPDLGTYAQQQPALVEKFGVPPEMAPSVQQIQDEAAKTGTTPQAVFDKLKSAYMEPQQTTAPKYSAPKEGIDEKGKPIVYQVGPDGDVRILGGVQPPPKKGMKIYDREGNLMVDTSGGEGPDLTKKTQGNIEQKLTDGSEQLSRMVGIYDTWKPEYNEVGTRFKAAWTGTKAFLGQPVEEQDRQLLTDFKTWQRKSAENINLYIKELTGAQMSQKEADRLKLAQPDPGEKWWQGDDPITFKAKMDDVIKSTRAAIARWNYYKAQGISEDMIVKMINDGRAVPLDDLISGMK